METTPDQLQDAELPGLAEYLEVFGRRRATFFVTALAILVTALALAFGLPPVYRSSATILIEQPEIPKELVPSTITSFADQRVQMISQRVMTTANLQRIIEKYGLYPDERESEPMESVIEEMRDDITLEMVSADVIDPRTGKPGQANIAFTLAFEYGDPVLAQQVANELVSLFLQENLKDRTEQATSASEFLAQQADALKEKIAELEQQLADFKQKNVENLPELFALNTQLMDRTEKELTDVQQQLRSLEDRRIYLRSELLKVSPQTDLYSETGRPILGAGDQLKIKRTEYLTLLAKYSPDHPDVVRLRKEIEALEQEAGKGGARAEIEARLEGLRGELAAARERYSDSHPDVKRLRRTIAELEKELASAPAAPVPKAVEEEPNNPVWIQLKAQLESANAEYASLKAREAELREKLTDYERRLTLTPQVEREYNELTRDYQNAQLEYKEVRDKQMSAQLARNLESERKGERFTLIEPPLLPQEPAKPNRLAIGFLGLVLSLGGGLASVAMAEALDQTVHGRAGLRRLVGEPPLAVIPRIETAADRRGRVLRRLLTLLLLLALLAGALLAVHLLIMPLDVLWFTALRKLGM
ncbi:MAG: lipopolysaccharide biosynthesis protein [Gammaproteobacteria bacterium]|nr:MAG: lipopolysaccharide biosynthesis protein [Gammaproteobacteria bacterium]